MGGPVAVFAVKAIASAAAGALVSKVTQKKPKADPALSAAQRRQSQLIVQQQAAQTRLQQQTDAQEATLDRQLASTIRAAAARRRGRGALAFNGPNTGLKTTLGG